MKLWPGLLSDRRAREKWEAELAWFRLRYQEPVGPTRCLKLLSRAAACGRIALYYRPGAESGPVARLYLGIPGQHVRLLQRMAGDFGLMLKLVPPDATMPPVRRLAPASELPWNRPFVGHLVAETLYAGPLDEESSRGDFLPHPSRVSRVSEWQLPAAPPSGLTTVPSWNGQEPPAHLIASVPNPQSWLLGRSRQGQPLEVSGRINMYGRQEAVAAWLTSQITQMMAVEPANLVVIDGAGDLVSRLKRKRAITRLLGDGLAYLDLDGAWLADGFNPLAPVPGETEEALVGRWQRWFQGMNVHPQGLGLLVQARQAGVEDIPGLRKWLKRAERQGQYAAVSSLGLAINRLTASRNLREWLEWPTNRFEILPGGALFFACKGSSWDRRHLLRGVLLASLAVRDARVVVHGFPWKMVEDGLLHRRERLIISNGPPLPGATTVLVETLPEHVDILAGRFLSHDAQLAENLTLLGPGEGIVLSNGEAVYTTWQNGNHP
jgi:hypothetical protein